MDMLNVQVGDEVIVLDRTSRTMRNYKGKVVQAGRKLFNVEYFPFGDGGRSEIKTFRMEGGVSNDKYGYYRVDTPEHQAEVERRDQAMDVIRNAGLTYARGSAINGETSTPLLEAIAKVIETWNQEGWAGEPDVQTLLGEAHSQSISGNWSF